MVPVVGTDIFKMKIVCLLETSTDNWITEVNSATLKYLIIRSTFPHLTIQHVNFPAYEQTQSMSCPGRQKMAANYKA